MDTSSTALTTDILGRRTGPRRLRTTEEKRRIVEETLVAGASVATVARRHEVNANLVFGWRRLYQKGLLEATAPASAAMLPVRVESPTIVPGKRMSKRTASKRASAGGWIEIEFPGGRQLRVHGAVNTTALERIIDVLSRR